MNAHLAADLALYGIWLIVPCGRMHACNYIGSSTLTWALPFILMCSNSRDRNNIMCMHALPWPKADLHRATGCSLAAACQKLFQMADLSGI